MINDDTLDNLISEFAEATALHWEFDMCGKPDDGDIQAARLRRIFLKIIANDDRGRQALFELTEHRNKAVALSAAMYSLKYLPDKSLEVLEELSNQPELKGLKAQIAIINWRNEARSIEDMEDKPTYVIEW